MGERQAARQALWESSAARNFEAGDFSTAVDLECGHNLDVTARILLTGESNFCAACNFKELGVAKRAQSTTSTRCASRRALRGIGRTDSRGLQKLDAVQPKLFRTARQDDYRISDCTGSSFKSLAVRMWPC